MKIRRNVLKDYKDMNQEEYSFRILELISWCKNCYGGNVPITIYNSYFHIRHIGKGQILEIPFELNKINNYVYRLEKTYQIYQSYLDECKIVDNITNNIINSITPESLKCIYPIHSKYPDKPEGFASMS